jgi:hypothetical protein
MNTLKKMEKGCYCIGKYIIYYDQIIGKGATATVFKGKSPLT